MAVVDGSGAVTVFAKNASGGTYVPTGDDADSGLTLTPGTPGTNGPASWTVSDLDGNSTIFNPSPALTSPPSAGSPNSYRVGSISQPGSGQTTTYTYDASGKPTQLLAPTPAGSTCAAWVPGCRALNLAYNTAGLVTSLTYKTANPDGTALSVLVVKGQ